MFRYSTMYINIISILVSILIFSCIQVFLSNYKNFGQKSSLKASFSVENQSQNQTNIPKEDEKIKNKETEEKNTEDIWYIEIPTINLKADIREGTKKETLDDYVGHFEETPKIEGNVALAAHNRGYKHNYFENLKKLKEGDSVLYYYKNISKEYKVKRIAIIKDTDWKSLENTKENMITLITCVENQPEYRRCIQAVENSV